MLSGDGATGKSLLALQGLLSPSRPAAIGSASSPEPGGALYVSAEDEIEELHRRLARIVLEA